MFVPCVSILWRVWIGADEYSSLYEKKYRKMDPHGGKNGSFDTFLALLEKYDMIFEDIKKMDINSHFDREKY